MKRVAFGDRGEQREVLRRLATMIEARSPLPRSSLFIGEAGIALFLALAGCELARERLAAALPRPSRLATFGGGYFGELMAAEMLALLGADVELDVDEALDARLPAPPPAPDVGPVTG